MYVNVRGKGDEGCTTMLIRRTVAVVRGGDEERVVPLADLDEVCVERAHDVVDRQQRLQPVAMLEGDRGLIGSVDDRFERGERAAVAAV